MPKILVRRGLDANIPVFDIGEPGFATDTKRVFIGSDEGNVEIAKKESVDPIQTELNNARGGLPTLVERLDVVDEQLADIAINIKSLGAKTDGTDSTQAFINARAKSKYIFVPEGTFVIDNLTLQDVVLFGNGTLQWKSGSITKMLELRGRCVVEGLTFDGNGTQQGTSTLSAIKLTTADKTTFRNNLFTNFHYKVINSDIALSANVQVLNNRFESCGTLTGCDVVTVKSSDWLLSGNFFSNIGDGHSIRLGLMDGDPTTTPVERIIVSNNKFKDTQHNGVTCEIYTKNSIITGNTFENLPQAIKMELAGNTVDNITISNNVIRNITLSTALNLVGDKVKFIGNRCYNLVGGPIFSNYFDCSNNEFYSCGDVATSSPVIAVTSTSTQGIVNNNLIVDAKYYGINIIAGNITGNRVLNCANYAIRVQGAGSVITGNYVDGALRGIVLVGTTTNTLVGNNAIYNTTEQAISYTNNTAFQSVWIKENLGYQMPEVGATIASDAITVSFSSRSVRVGSEGAATTDNLATISGGYIGQLVILRALSTAQVITVQDNVGNIDLNGTTSFVLNNANDALTLMWTGTKWIELARSDNA
jgi:parallel beta-helix repeat protein